MTAQPSWFTGILIETDWRQAPADLQKRARFFNNTQHDLIRISQLPLGAELLTLIAKRHEGIGTSESGAKRTVTIRIGKDGSEGADAQAWVVDDRFNEEKALRVDGRRIRFAGPGSRTIIYYHNDVNSEAIYTRLVGIHMPTYIALAHELIHALHHLGGNAYQDSVDVRDGGKAKREEMFTTGLGVYANTRISENAIRRQANLPLRTSYAFPNDHTHIASLAPALSGRLPKGYWYCHCVREHFG